MYVNLFILNRFILSHAETQRTQSRKNTMFVIFIYNYFLCDSATLREIFSASQRGVRCAVARNPAFIRVSA